MNAEINRDSQRVKEKWTTVKLKSVVYKVTKRDYAKEVGEPSIQCSWLRAIPIEFTHERDLKCNVHQQKMLFFLHSIEDNCTFTQLKPMMKGRHGQQMGIRST